MRWRMVGRNAAALTDPPRVPHREVHPFSPEQARSFLDSLQGDRLEALYTGALALGLRQGEALGLKWEDLDLEAGTLQVNRALQRFDGAYHFVDPKTEKARRTIALPAFAIPPLRAHRQRQLQERLQAGADWVDWGLVFSTTRGKPLDGSNTTRRFQALVERAGLPRQRFHDLRHGAASLLMAQGVHPRVVMEILGHSQIAVTMNLYSHVVPSLQRDAANLMDALFTAEK